MALENQKQKITEFLKSFHLEPGDLSYLDEKYAEDNATAQQVTKEVMENGKEKIDSEVLKENSASPLLDGQWSGYVYGISQDATKFYFYTSCGVTGTPQYYIYLTQIVSLKQTGICYQYSLYYLVYNY
jgi:hypothetical protein